jgi:hypothetical protein
VDISGSIPMASNRQRGSIGEAGTVDDFLEGMALLEGNAAVLDVSTHHDPVEVGGDVPPFGSAGIHAAAEHARRRWQWLVAQAVPPVSAGPVFAWKRPLNRSGTAACSGSLDLGAGFSARVVGQRLGDRQLSHPARSPLPSSRSPGRRGRTRAIV